MTLKELREQLGQQNAAAQKIMDAATADGNRDMNAEESGQVDEIFDEYDKTKAQIDTIEGNQKRKDTLASNQSYLEQSRGRQTQPTVPGGNDMGRSGRDEPISIDIGGQAVLIDPHKNEQSYRRAGDDYNAAFTDYLASGVINPQSGIRADIDSDGGFLVAPIQMVARLIQDLDNQVFMRGLSTVLPPLTAAASVGAPSLDTDVADADWTSEIKAASEDTVMAFGGRELTPHPLSKLVKVSNKLLMLALMNPEQIVRERLAYKFGVTEEKGFLTGHGANQPLGVFTASAAGIPTGRDVSTGNTATTITADGLINAKYSLKAGYQSRASWIFHRDVVKFIRKLKTTDLQYIWQAGLAGGQPDTILDSPFFMSEYAPSTFTASLYLGIIGDFSNYWIVDSLTFAIQRLAELFALTDQTGFIGRKNTDGMPVLGEAFARVKTTA